MTLATSLTIDKPKLWIPLEKYRRIMAYVDLCETEVSGFFDVQYDAENHAFVINEVYLIDQEAGGSDTEMDDQAIAKFMEELIEQGHDQMPQGWWHSHVNMSVFWSSTDENTINNDFVNDTFTVSLVVNKKRDMKATIMIYQPMPYGILPTPLRIDDPAITIKLDTPEISEDLRAEVKAKVKTRKPIIINNKKGFLFSKKNSQGKSNLLPKDKERALERIADLDLVRTWDADLNDITYVDKLKNEVWLDQWGIIKYEDYLEIKGGKDDTEGFTKTRKPRPYRKCRLCGYWEEAHSEDVCTTPDFEEVAGGILMPEDLSDEELAALAHLNPKGYYND